MYIQKSIYIRKYFAGSEWIDILKEFIKQTVGIVIEI